MSHGFNARSLVELMVANELIDAGISADDGRHAMLTLHKEWRTFIGAPDRDHVLVMWRMAGMKASPGIGISE